MILDRLTRREALTGIAHAESLIRKQDFSVLQLAYTFEQATGFGKKHPPIA